MPVPTLHSSCTPEALPGVSVVSAPAHERRPSPRRAWGQVPGTSTVMARAWVAVLLSASVTVAEKVVVPSTVGVPEMTPVAGARLSPAGRLPLEIAQT